MVEEHLMLVYLNRIATATEQIAASVTMQAEAYAGEIRRACAHPAEARDLHAGGTMGSRPQYKCRICGVIVEAEV
jgi:hypothetical protein